MLALLSLLAREPSVATLTRRVPGGVEELARALEMYAGDADVEERAKLAVAQVGLAVTSADGGGAMPTLAPPGGGGSIGGSVSASVGKTPSYLKRTGAVKTDTLNSAGLAMIGGPLGGVGGGGGGGGGGATRAA